MQVFLKLIETLVFAPVALIVIFVALGAVTAIVLSRRSKRGP